MFKLSSLAFASLLAASGAAQAVTYNYAGNTTGAPTYNRALQDFSGLSSLGSAVNYQKLEFTVSAGGSYVFTSAAKGAGTTSCFSMGRRSILRRR